VSKRLPPDMRERTCATNLKRPYLTRAIALMHASRFQKRHGGTRLNPYKCPGCRMWHLTSQEAKRG
jgi:hypothetical protein